ncbi:putative oxidoreductase [Thermosporothrix hazakensis]|jgi:putative oxidoreductase|uniref:Putative oxidoreductase n=1 Tax=Thermosporothrix hazakensis TaxID=644383 RepID=A0A326U3X0_THEHA|nr:DoxX family protein [Thermosporothrix hazakensis]PZW23600.1 putative oxidoreductase [Thermosporothrix hazakensis]GCE51033.1 hypothetical protein KTH_59020 [Thermosporothrix hazakensis]
MKIFQTNSNPTFNISTLLLRLALAIVIFPHGAQKMLGWFGGGGVGGTLQFFGMLGIPAILGILVILGEFLGSLGVLTGLLTRVAAFGIACAQLGAIFFIHAHNGFFMNWSGKQAGEGIEFFLLTVGISLALMIMGAGGWSLDALISGLRKKK